MVFITFIQGIYSYIPETNHIYRAIYYVLLAVRLDTTV